MIDRSESRNKNNAIAESGRRNRIVTEFRNKDYVLKLAGKLRDIYPGGRINIMEVCGTHTMAIARFGLRGILPEGLRLVSGPGCPVCVTPASTISMALELAENQDNVVVSFGDMMRVPANGQSLEKLRGEGADVRVVYSPHDAIDIAENTEKNVIFISVGFETTTPGIALTLLEAEEKGLKNLYFLTANRFIIPAMRALCSDENIRIDGFLCPGHVSVIIGANAYNEIAGDFGKPCVVSGFEPVDIMLAVYELVKLISEHKPRVVNMYERVVTGEGNRSALSVMDRVFKRVDAEWRGIGVIPESGGVLQDDYAERDAELKFGVDPEKIDDPGGCRCGDVLKGIILPPECPLFGKRCVPDDPVGPCMVSSEGSCAAYYRYRSVG